MYAYKKLIAGISTIVKGEIGMWSILLLLTGIIWVVSKIF